jgi:protein-serine/threonine kinase
MEYLPGGDMMSLLIKLDVFPEEMCRFYIAECVLAIESVHKLDFVHRDIKPDNILFDTKGHVKLTDFGLSTGFHKTHDTHYHQKVLKGLSSKSRQRPAAEKLNDKKRIDLTLHNRDPVDSWKRNRRNLAFSTVGTPDYIAPEVFKNRGYGKECDWWSLGAIMFEMLMGYPPFCSESHTETYQKIIHWKEFLSFPPDIYVSPTAENLIRRLLCDAESRLGRFGADEIKAHPFFTGIDWESIHSAAAPFIPKLRSIADTSHFPIEDLQQTTEEPPPAAIPESGTLARQKDLAFVGYTFRRFETLARQNAL